MPWNSAMRSGPRSGTASARTGKAPAGGGRDRPDAAPDTCRRGASAARPLRPAELWWSTMIPGGYLRWLPVGATAVALVLAGLVGTRHLVACYRQRGVPA